MSTLRVAWFGDVVGRPGRLAVAHAAPAIRAAHAPDLVVANVENVRHGRGVHPVGYEEVRAAGVDLFTLGDHVLDDERMLPILEDPAHPIGAPVNLSQWPKAKRWVVAPTAPALHVVTVLGRLFMRYEVEPPFESLDAAIGSIVGDDPDALVLVEVHAEATSEKVAMVWHCHERWAGHVVAVVGSHTHVQTSDARIVGGRLAALTDLGMCGGRGGVIGFNTRASLERLIGTRGTSLDVASEDPVAEGCVITIDTGGRRAAGIEAFRIGCPGPGRDT